MQLSKNGYALGSLTPDVHQGLPGSETLVR